MVKVITSIRRKPGMAVDEFQRYWREQHPAVVTALPGLRRYVQSHVLPTGYRKGDPPWDGIAEVWADDTDALRAMTRSAANLAVQADEARFIDRASMGLIVTEEHTVLDGPAGPEAVKGIEFLSRRPDLSVEAFQEHWRTRHASILAKIPGLTRCVLSPPGAPPTRRAARPSTTGSRSCGSPRPRPCAAPPPRRRTPTLSPIVRPSWPRACRRSSSPTSTSSSADADVLRRIP
jgi:uncharacterized protein (TIGR02118 family)